MKVPDRFYIVLRGSRAWVRQRENMVSGIGHNLGQLVTYRGDIPEVFLRPWGITAHVEEDTDQGDDEG